MNKLKILSAGICAFFVCGLIALCACCFIFFDNMIPFYVVFAFIFIFDAIIGLYILNSNRSANVKACWIFVILLIPMFGVLIFLIFGVIPLTKKKWSEHNRQQLSLVQYENFDDCRKIIKNNSSDRHLFYYGLINSLRPIYQYNGIEIIHETPELYQKSIDLIRSAQKTICLQSYILHDGFWLRTLCTELIKKAKEGVQIKILYDWVGCYFRLKRKTIKELKKHGISVGIFNPKGFNMFKSSSNFRSHRKILIIDNKIALYGGSNIGDEYLSLSQETNYWRDQNFIVSGEIVNTFSVMFYSDWLDFTDYSVKNKDKKELKDNLQKYLKIIPNKKHKIVAQAIESSPDYVQTTIKDLIITAIHNASKNIRIVSPYLCPTDDLLSALTIAALSGVKIQIILPGKNDDKNFILMMNRSFYSKLLDVGIEIYEYDGFIHSKYMIIDDKHVFTGSYNLDFRSLIINFENSLIISNTNFAKNLINNCFVKDLENSKLINQDILKSYIKIKDKVKMWFLAVWLPLL